MNSKEPSYSMYKLNEISQGIITNKYFSIQIDPELSQIS